MFVLAVVSHGAFMAGGVFMSPHPRVHNAGKVPPPQHNCEVRAVRVHMKADGEGKRVFVLEAPPKL